jgi:uncharacterized membrane-anchored protein YjiN (DUF445 family)
MTLPIPDAARLAALRRMKRTASGLLLAAAAVFVVCAAVGHGRGAWGFVQAAAEASMVGGLADWFAVTALFRHPLGVPIPHTAIIPRKKDQLGAGLATFVQRYFLTGDVVVERLIAVDAPRKVGEWLAQPEHAARVADEVGVLFRAGADLVNDDDLRASAARYADKKIREVDVAPVAARVLEALVNAGEHQVALGAGLRGLMRFLAENEGVFRERLYQESPEWVPQWVDDRVFVRGFSAVEKFLRDVEGDPDHLLRRQFDTQLRAYAEALRTDPSKAERLEQAKNSLLEHPEVRSWLASLGVVLKTAVVEAAADPDSELRRTAGSLVARLADALQHNDELRGRIQQLLERAVRHVLVSYGDDIAELISGTVARWDSEETGRRLELQVGRDLQFIRINGTVVGALVGLVIYSVGHFL